MKANDLAKSVATQLKSVSDCPLFEARCLVSQLWQLRMDDVYLNVPLNPFPLAALEQAVQKRLRHIPLQYILGKWEFMGYEFVVNENVLIPRPETELLCECLQADISPQSVVYDVCAGSGCVGISVAKETGATVFAIEKYALALDVLQQNIVLNDCENLVTPVQWDITEAPPVALEAADVILSNPPYIENKAIAALQQEVQCEPHTALDGGADGLAFYQAIATRCLPLLKPGGFAAFEIGEGQEQSVINIFSSLQHLKTMKDYNNIARVVIFRKG